MHVLNLKTAFEDYLNQNPSKSYSTVNKKFEMKLVELMYNYLFIIYVVFYINKVDDDVMQAALDHLIWYSPQRYIKGDFKTDI
jgi:hypothetical protein